MSLLSRLPTEPLRLISLHLGKRVETCLYSTSASVRADKKAYSHTLRLPKTSLPLKHKVPVDVEAKLRHKISDELYIWQREKNTGPPFVFLDGPPYANGNLHMGHALNKILKDFINRYKVLRGHRVHFEPGWDCHGLPIEQKALQIVGKSHTALDPIQIRQIARNTATEAIEVQKKEMRDLGVMADWDNHDATYRTMDRDFELRQLELFKQMVEKGQIFYRLRPSYYSPAARTALAESELKYMDDHESKSVYVGFDLKAEDMSPSLRAVWTDLNIPSSPSRLELAIWTTTPWTLPSNLGVAVSDSLEYSIVKSPSDRYLIIQSARVGPMAEVLGPLQVMTTIRGSDIVGSKYSHLFRAPDSTKLRLEVLHSDHVSVESGTGLVHMAPAHGHEDYEAFTGAGRLPDDLLCPVDRDGCYDSSLADIVDLDDSSLGKLIGKRVLGEGNDRVIEMLGENGSLLALQPIKHRYPYDWKTKTPVIILASPQWFADVGVAKPRAIESLGNVDFRPPQSRHRLESFIQSRSEWCISRQRSWGVPIPILFNVDGAPVIKHLSHTLAVLEAKGIDHWWQGPIEDFVSPGQPVGGLSKGRDTLDVWFDSGSAWTSIDGKYGRSSEQPLADVCLEGSDQHRGWFQSSLLTRLITTTEAGPVAGAIITHGMVMDEEGKKMSKSDGNGISPMDVVYGENGQKPLGADALRLWVASVDYSKDVSVGPSSLGQAAEVLRKIRSVMRFMLGNVTNRDNRDTTPHGFEYNLLDKFVLQELDQLEQKVVDAYDNYAFNRALQAISTFASSTLSFLYFDAIKDTLYCDSINNPRRAAAVAVLDQVLNRMLKIIAPLAPHLAEEINQALPHPFSPSIFSAKWEPRVFDPDDAVTVEMQSLLEIRQNVQILIETCRTDKILRQPSEVDLYVKFLDSNTSDLFRRHECLLPALMTTSCVRLDQEPTDVSWTRQSKYTSYSLSVAPAKGKQCPRCWLHQSAVEDGVCSRCSARQGGGWEDLEKLGFWA